MNNAGYFPKAGNDLRAGTFELGAVPPLTSDIMFHTQQAAEKAMKGFLTWHGQVYRKTHNLVEIGEACAAIDPTLEPLLRRAAELRSTPEGFGTQAILKSPPRKRPEKPWRSLARCSIRSCTACCQMSTRNS